MKFNQIIDAIKTSKHIVISGHVNPDGDAIGAIAGVVGICQFFHIPYTVMMEEVPSKYSYLLQGISVTAQLPPSWDTFIALDCGDTKRLGIFEEAFLQSNRTINIDHHHTNEGFAMLNYVDKQGSSTSECIFRLIEEAKVPMNNQLAIAIYTGIVFDTGGFMHPSTKPSTHRIAARLLERDIDYSKIYHHIIHARTPMTIKMQGVVTANMIGLKDGKIILSYVTQDEMKRHGAIKSDVDGIVNYLKNIVGVEVAGLLYEIEPNVYKLSLRSVAPHDVAEICQQFGGGGHIRAAGATLQGELSDVLIRVKAAVQVKM